MRRTLCLLAAFSLMASAASARPSRCTAAGDDTAFDVGALKSELSVLAVGCSDEDDYNRFVERFRTGLVAQDRVVNTWFSRTYGRAAQKEYDSYITLLANLQSQVGSREGSDYCPRSKLLFTEVMALPDIAMLPQYAAGKDLIPNDMAACDTAIARTGTASTSSRRPAARSSRPAHR